MRILIAGVAGFIGSHLSERLLSLGHEIVGIDCFLDYYPRWIKEENLAASLKNPRFHFLEANLLDLDLEGLLREVEIVFHQAAQAGVRASWGRQFDVYTRNNINATQKLLEAAKGAKLSRFIYASSSSVYGDSPRLPLREDGPLRPTSPYGVTKLAAENLCRLYYQAEKIPVVALRYFTVFGPRQRPDMAFHRFFRAIISGQELTLYGDGLQTRDFTYIEDIIDANLLVMEKGPAGEIYNIGGGANITLKEVLKSMETLTGKKTPINFLPRQKGDMLNTLADISKAEKLLGYTPKIRLEEGCKHQWQWMQKFMIKAKERETNYAAK